MSATLCFKRAAASSRHVEILPRHCDQHEAHDAAWRAMQDAGADFSTEAAATCQAAGLPDEHVRTLTLAGNGEFINAFLALAEDWRIGGRA